jgi:hypothetical protein
MTLVVVRVDADAVEVLTDSLVYNPTSVQMAECSKATLYPHLGTVSVTQGAHELSEFWHAAVVGDPTRVRSLDDLDARAAEVLPEAWALLGHREGIREFAFITVAGWSPGRERFTALRYDSRAAFAPEEISGLFSFPLPANKVGQPPRTDQQWVALAKKAHDRHSLASVMTGRKVFIGGGLVLTRLERGRSEHREIYRFPQGQGNADWRRMLVGTLHPLGQLGPCVCGQGQPAAVCHLRWISPDSPCSCESGKTWAECHRIDPDSEQARAYWREHADDFWRWSRGLAAVYRAARPDEDAHPPPVVVPPARS